MNMMKSVLASRQANRSTKVCLNEIRSSNHSFALLKWVAEHVGHEFDPFDDIF